MKTQNKKLILHTSVRRRRGFTLVELLVVIAIIAVLASLSYVGARSAYLKSKAVTTTSNLRQIGTVITMIQEDGIENGWNRSGTFPPYAGHIVDDAGWRKFSIYELIGEQIGACEVSNGKYVWSRHPQDTILQNPLSKIKFAGEVKELSEVDNASLQGGSYCYNAYVEGWVAPHSAQPKLTRLIGRDIAYPSRTILMAERNDVEGKIFTGWKNSAPHGNYKDGAYCLFVDGHVEHLKNDWLASPEGLKKHMNLNSSPD